MENLGVTIHKLRGELKHFSTKALYRYGITFYDSAYVRLAMMENGALYAADKEVVAKTMLPNVKHLSELAP
ncbi:hypothetical protein CSUB_C0328 [Candidatus Caldarchaeum subterraneum]|uniref:PIN domain-containing protein n=1 Tax=Caldiarchaeum subterraneum TaxID=311458 RepID=E6N4Z9_CALS0|nr:hypothetical protein HGMM_F55E04C24 [Candidatus Caldarchaeum subterraneum]BAJ50189.1 hypothetical protein CSUB_C0328 [Candidatus Caldarchaeum subterraneum]